MTTDESPGVPRRRLILSRLFEPPAGSLAPATRRPLLPVKVVMILADRSEREILAAIDRGQLPWTFDISISGAGRREIRVWRGSLEFFFSRGMRQMRQFTLPEIIASVLPFLAGDPQKATIRGAELQRRWACSARHIATLVAHGLLQSAPRRRINESPSILYASAAEFLQRRCLSHHAVHKNRAA